MPRYLDVPLWLSEDEDMQQHAVSYCNTLAQKAMALAEKIADAMDQYPDYWKPDNLLDLENLVTDLEHAVAMMKHNNLIVEGPKCE